MITLNSNEYFSGLENFIVFMRMYATNTSKREQRLVDVFCTDTLSFGDQKVFPFAELPKVGDYSTTSSLLSDASIKYNEEFIGDPIKKKIPLTTIEAYLKMAMINATGMGNFMGYVYGLMDSAKYDYLFWEIMKDLISWTPTNSAGKKMVQTIELYDTSKATTAVEENAQELLNQKKIEQLWQKSFDDFSLFTDLFIDINNKTGTTDETNFKTALNLEDLIFIGNAKYLNERVVNLMATMLRSGEIDKNFRHPDTLKVPQLVFDNNNASNCIGFVAHKYWYQWFYHFTFMGSFFDPDTVRLKRILHFWYSKGRLKNLPAMRLNSTFKAVEP